MPDPFEGIDFSEYTRPPAPLVATSPTPSPIPGPSGVLGGADPFANEDFSMFTATPAPLTQVPIPRTPIGMAPLPSRGQSIISGLMTPSPRYPDLAPPEKSRDPASVPPSPDRLRREWAALQAHIAGSRGSPVDYSWVPKDFAGYAVMRLSPFDQSAPLDAKPLGERGLGASFTGELSHGMNRLGSMIARGQLAPDRGLEEAHAQELQNYSNPSFSEKVAGGLGGSVPALATIMATRGRTMPVATGSMAVPLETGATAFVQGLADPNRTPEQNISGSLIEALITRAGGSFEPGFGTPTPQFPKRIVGEGLEEGAAGGLGDISEQVNAPGFSGNLDLDQTLENAAIGAVSGPIAAGTLGLPGAVFSDVPADPVPAPVLDSDELRPEVEVETDPADHAAFDAIESVSDDNPIIPNPMHQADPEGAIYGEISDEDAEVINKRIDEAFAKEQADEDFEANQARTVLDPVDVEVKDLQDFTTTQALPLVAAAQYDVARANQEDAADPAPEFKGPPKPAKPVAPAFKTPFAPTGPQKNRAELVREAEEHGQIAADAYAADQDQEIQDLGGRKPAAPLQPKAPAFQTPFKPRDIETRPEPTEAFKVDDAPQKPQPPGPIQDSIDYGTPAQPAVAQTPTAPVPAKPAAPIAAFPSRGSLKGARAAREFFGPAVGTKTPAPKGFEKLGVRVFKDAGMHPMSVKMAGKYGVAWDEERGKAIMVMRTDAKGRHDPEGTELRPVDATGVPRTVSEHQDVPKFESSEEAAKFIGRNLTAAVPDAKPAGGFGVQDAAIRDKEVNLDAIDDDDAADQARRDELLSRVDRGEELTDDELNEADAIEARIKGRKEQPGAPAVQAAPEAKAPAAPAALKPIPNSPLTPKSRAEIADLIDDDMPAGAIGKIIENVLEGQLRRKPTREEWSAAVSDARKNGLIQESQGVSRDQDVGANMFLNSVVPALAKLTGLSPGGYIRQWYGDLSSDNSAIAEVSEAIKPGQFGYTPKQIARGIMRTFGPLGRGTPAAWVEDTAAKMTSLLTARTVAAMFPEFRPVLSLAQSQIDKSRLSFQENFDAVAPLRKLPEASLRRAEGAMIQFRLEDRAPKDFNKPVTYTNEQGQQLQYTLTPREIGAVEATFAATKKSLVDYVDVMKQVFSIPPSVTTSAELTKQIAAGNIPAHAKMLETPMRILETGKNNYIPLKRYGNKYHAVIYDAAKFNAARTKAQRKAAELGFIKAESNSDLNRQIAEAGHRFPGSYILAYEEREQVDGDRSPIDAKDLLALADLAGVPPVVLQDFIDAGVGSYLETRGIGARFAEAKKVAGFSHDVLRGVASHLQDMAHATERLRHRHLMELSTKKIKDPGLKQFSNRFIERIDTPVSQLVQGARQLTTLYFLGLGVVSAFVNSTTAMIFQPLAIALASRNPIAGIQASAKAIREQFNALTRILSLGLNSTKLGRGVDQVEQAAERYDSSNPALADAIRKAAKAGTFTNVFEREADQIAKRGEESIGSKVRNGISQGLMYFFAKVETANRLAAFISGYDMHTNYGGVKRYDDFADNLGFSRGGTPEEFGAFFSDFNNFRMDKTDMPSWAQGSFKKNAQGKEVFTPSTIRPLAYALKGWGVNFLQQQMLLLRAAVKGGWIDRGHYIALSMAVLTTFGAYNMVPGLRSLDALVKAGSGELTSPAEKLKAEGGISRVMTTGWPGMVAEEFLGEQIGEVVDDLASRSGAGNVIPNVPDPSEPGSMSRFAVNTFAPLSVVDSQVRGFNNLMNPDSERKLEGAGQVLGKEATRVARAVNQTTGDRGFTTKTGDTLVPSESTALQGAPFLTTGDIWLSLLGAQPPVVREAYREQQMIRDMKTSNDAVVEYAVKNAVDAIIAKDKPAMTLVLQGLREWNSKAMDRGETWKVISGDAFRQAVTIELQARQMGARNLRPVPKGGRKAYLERFDEETPDENIKE